MGKACDTYLLKKRAYDRVAQELDDAVHRLRAFSRPLIEDCGCNVPLPGMSVHAYISASRRALEGSNTTKRRRIAELMKRPSLRRRKRFAHGSSFRTRSAANPSRRSTLSEMINGDRLHILKFPARRSGPFTAREVTMWMARRVCYALATRGCFAEERYHSTPATSSTSRATSAPNQARCRLPRGPSIDFHGR